MAKEKIIEAEVEEKKKETVVEHDKAYFFPRAIAYFVDIIIVVLISSLIIQFVPENKNYEKYKKEFTQIQEEFNKDRDIDKYMKKAVPVVYDIDYSNCSSMIVEVTVLVLYFVVFQAYNKGQTLGKKLMKIKIVSADGNDVNMNQIAIRSLIVNSILVNLMIIGALLFSNKDVYYYISLGFQGFGGLLVIISLIMILFRKDGKGLHDLLAKTQVISE